MYLYRLLSIVVFCCCIFTVIITDKAAILHDVQERHTKLDIYGGPRMICYEGPDE